MPKKIKYYDISNLLSTEAQYMMLLGQRANGKSYQAKKTVLEHFIKTGEKFVYLRRWQADIKIKAINKYFEDMPISKITNKQYTGLVAWNGSIYFTFENEKGEKVKGAECGTYCALNEYERYKSWAFVDYAYILYEEFITDSVYLVDEPRLLQQFVSTVARNKKMTVFLIGNTLSRVCPYFNEWCLDGVLKQKIGTIEIYHFHVEEEVINIAVEYCANSDAKNTMFFGQASKQIISGEWDTKDVPKLPKKQYEYEKVYEVLVEYQSFKFVVELLVEPREGGLLCFVYPFTGTRKIQRVISDTFSDSRFITKKLDINRRPEYLMSQCVKNDKICYSDNLTGSDFLHVIDRFKLV